MKSTRTKPATIYDIAKMTGFTTATVSRVLNGKGYMSKDTEDKIIEASKKLNYFPNPAARYLRNKKTNQLMISIPHMNDVFYFDLISAVYNMANENGYSLILNYTQEDINDELSMLRNLENHFIDGLILISINFTERHLNEIKRIKQPIVLSSIGLNKNFSSENKFDYVGVDTQKGVYLATEHLIKQGHTKIGYIGLPLNTQTGDERFEGFCQAMKLNNIQIDSKYVITGGYNETFGYEAGLQLLRSRNLPTAICTTCDHITAGLYKLFEEKGIRIPEDIATVGMDNIYLITTMMRPKMSSVAIASGEIGRAAAELIFRRLENPDKNYERIIFQPRLVVRDSSINIKKS